MKMLVATLAMAASTFGQTPTQPVVDAQKAATQSITDLTNTALAAGYNQGKSNTEPPVQPPKPSSTAINVWFNEGGDKVSQDELRMSKGRENLTGKVRNRAWDGTTLKLFGARNESVSFNAIIESPNADARGISVQFDTLSGPDGNKIRNTFGADKSNVFNWVGRPIELFYTKYVEIKGISTFGWYHGDERQIPPRFQAASHNWGDRPDHNKRYPDALIPLEVFPTFAVRGGTNQAVWGDIYISRQQAPGDYRGTIKFLQNGTTFKQVPVVLSVQPFTLPDKTTLVDFGHLDANDVLYRFVSGGSYVNWNTEGGRMAKRINDTYIQFLKRHRITIQNGETECPPEPGRVCSMNLNRFTGDLFTAANGYDGPGANQGIPLYAYAAYGTWSKDPNISREGMQNLVDPLGEWFKSTFPDVKTFFYLQDEPQQDSFGNVERWSRMIKNDPNPGNRIKPSATVDFVAALNNMPDLQIAINSIGLGNCDGCPNGDNTAYTNNAMRQFLQKPGNEIWLYNYNHPASGTSNTEDDGIAMRTLGWVQAKFDIKYYYYWFLNLESNMDLYQSACTWGCGNLRQDPQWGETGDGNYTNGNGILIYPGNDVVNRQDAYGIMGPVASVRLKEWRRGIQDAEYIYMARQYDANRANAIVQSTVPKVLWENKAPNGEVSWFQGPISWSSDPDVWENSRYQESQIIVQGCASNRKSFCNPGQSVPSFKKEFRAQIQEKK
jgi:hypothetical protein